jgi:hypothetical protein
MHVGPVCFRGKRAFFLHPCVCPRRVLIGLYAVQTNDYCSVKQDSRDALYIRYPGARRAFLKSGGDFPFLSRADEVNLHLQVSTRRAADREGHHSAGVCHFGGAILSVTGAEMMLQKLRALMRNQLKPFETMFYLLYEDLKTTEVGSAPCCACRQKSRESADSTSIVRPGESRKIDMHLVKELRTSFHPRLC